MAVLVSFYFSQKELLHGMHGINMSLQFKYLCERPALIFVKSKMLNGKDNRISIILLAVLNYSN